MDDDNVDPHIATFRLRDIPIGLLLGPFVALLGMHLYYIAVGVRKLLPIPFIVIAAILQSLQFACIAVILSGSVWYVAAVAATSLLLALLPPLVFDERDARREGYNAEHFAMGHLPAVLALMLLRPFLIGLSQYCTQQ